jgi:hypothetical protein
LRPQGFSPSRRFALPAAYRACFIPIPLLGFLGPPRLRSASGAVRTSRPAVTFRVSSLDRSRGPPVQGFARQTKADAGAGFYTGGPTPVASLGFSPPGLLATAVPADWPGVPHALSRPAPLRVRDVGAPGLDMRWRSRSLARSVWPPWGSAPRSPLASLGGFGRGYPSVAGPASLRTCRASLPDHPLPAGARRDGLFAAGAVEQVS